MLPCRRRWPRGWLIFFKACRVRAPLRTLWRRVVRLRWPCWEESTRQRRPPQLLMRLPRERTMYCARWAGTRGGRAPPVVGAMRCLPSTLCRKGCMQRLPFVAPCAPLSPLSLPVLQLRVLAAQGVLDAVRLLQSRRRLSYSVCTVVQDFLRAAEQHRWMGRRSVDGHAACVARLCDAACMRVPCTCPARGLLPSFIAHPAPCAVAVWPPVRQRRLQALSAGLLSTCWLWCRWKTCCACWPSCTLSALRPSPQGPVAWVSGTR